MVRISVCAQGRALCACLTLTIGAAVAQTVRVNLSHNGEEANATTYRCALSAGGRFVAFDSVSSNLVPNDTNWHVDVFVRDRDLGKTERVSVDSGGIQSNGPSYNPAISMDGRCVAFISAATNLVASDDNALPDVFLHDRATRTTTRVSVSTQGNQSNGPSYRCGISANGRFVIFDSDGRNLVPNDENDVPDVFVHDVQAKVTECASVSTWGQRADDTSFVGAISCDGRYVTYMSHASNLVDFDTNHAWDVFVRDRLLQTTVRESVSSNGTEGDSDSSWPAISADGSIVAFSSFATNFSPGDTNWAWDVFVRDRNTGATVRLSKGMNQTQANGGSFHPSISGDGRFVAFDSEADNLVVGDANQQIDAFVADRQTDVIRRVSVASEGGEGNAYSENAIVSWDGWYVAYSSDSENLVPADTNLARDIFVRSWRTASVETYGAGWPGSAGVPEFGILQAPILGSTVDLKLGNSAQAVMPGLVLYGEASAQAPTAFDGDLLVEWTVCVPRIVPAYGEVVPTKIPDERELVGRQCFLQYVQMDPGASKGVAFSRGLRLVLGY